MEGPVAHDNNVFFFWSSWKWGVRFVSIPHPVEAMAFLKSGFA